MAEGALLSVVITAYTTDRLQDIYALLDSMKAQTYGQIEVVFVAERSRDLFDRVKTYAEETGIRSLLLVYNDGEPGASAARNLGITKATGDVVAFIDDDAVAYPDWAEKMMQTYRDDSIVGVTGPAFALWPESPATWFPEEFYWILSCTSWAKWDKSTEVRNIWLQNGSFRSEAFRQAGTLNTALGPNDSVQGFKGREFKKGVVSEEVELSIRVRRATKRRIVFNPEVRVNHRVDPRRLKIGFVARWSYWMGCSKHRLKRLHPDSDSDLLTQERRLLGRIVTRLVPSMIAGVFVHPVSTLRRLSVTVTALTCVSAGYLAGFAPLEKQPETTSR